MLDCSPISERLGGDLLLQNAPQEDVNDDMSIEDEHTVQDNQSSFMTSNPQPFKASFASYLSSSEAR